MPKSQTDKVGTQTSKIHDNKTKFLLSEEKYHFIKKIYCYTSEEGIHGFFPVYKDENLNTEILQDSFYQDFQKDFLEKLNSKLIAHQKSLKIHTIEFSDKEVINSLVCKYEENHQKIVAIKIKTTKTNYFIGDNLLLNKSLPKIGKTEHFIPGLKLSFTQDNNLIFLSSVQAYFENDNNYHKYVVAEPTRNYLGFVLSFYNFMENVIFKISKVLFVLFLIFSLFIFLLKSCNDITGGDIIISEDRNVLHDIVKVHTDENGIPHIKAVNMEDAYFSIGFVHAKERLWQIEFLRRLARGRLSEFFGEKTLEIDRFIRSIGLNYIIDKNSEYYMYNSKHYPLLQKYVDGINYYAMNFPLPLEYRITFNTNNFKPWEFSDTIAVGHMMSFSVSGDWQMEVWQKYLEENLGKEFADIIISFKEMNHPFSNESVITDDELVELNMHKNRKKSHEAIKAEREKAEKLAKQELKKIKPEKKRAMKSQEKLSDNKSLSEAEVANKTIDNNSERVENNYDNKNDNNSAEKVNIAQDNSSNGYDQNLSLDAASNNWVISGAHTQSETPILANDPHLPNTLPSNFFILKVYLPDNTLSGSTYPGMPFVIIGSNKNVAWGITTENGDIVDVCEEKIDDDFYIYENKKYKLVETEEVIDIKGGKQEKMVLKWTRNGPLINKIPKNFMRLNVNVSYDVPLSFRMYSYLFEFTSFDFLMKLNLAENYQTIVNEAELFTITNFHLVWATKDDIGYQPIGNFAVKNYKNRLCRGYSAQDDIGKFLKRIDLPYIKNPKKGFIVSANNRFANFNYTYQLNGWFFTTRAHRIRQLIEEKIKNLEKFDIKDNIRIVQDQKDVIAEVILPKILDIYERNLKKNSNQNANNNNISKYFTLLRNWDYVLSKNSTAATIYSILEYNLGRKLLGNKLPDQQYDAILNIHHYWNFISGIILKIHTEEEVELSQCANLGRSKNCEKYIYSLFNNLDDYLADFKDSQNNVKSWGQVFSNHFAHTPFDTNPYLNKMFSRTIPSGGNRNTVNVAVNKFNNEMNKFVSSHSANTKFICDLSQPTRPYIIGNIGNSGNLLSKYYDNFLEKNEKGELIQLIDVDFDRIEKADSRTIFIRPLYPIEAKPSSSQIKH